MLRCDLIGCVYRRHGAIVSIVNEERALAEDCRIADVVVAKVPVRRRDCRAPVVVIDRFDLWRNGGHALWIGNEEIRVRSVGEDRGRRPWATQP